VSSTVIVFAIALVAWTTEGAIGFGGTVIAACIGAQFVPLDTLLPAFVVINLALSLSIVARTYSSIAWRLLGVDIAIPVALGAAGGIALARSAPAALVPAFGGFVVALAVLQLVRPADRPLALVPRLALLVVGGIAHGMFGTGGPMIVYVARRKLPDKRAFRATLAVLWITLNIALVTSFATQGAYTTEVRNLGLVIAPALIPGLIAGEQLHKRLDAARFERIVWILLLVAGSALVIRSL